MLEDMQIKQEIKMENIDIDESVPFDDYGSMSEFCLPSEDLFKKFEMDPEYLNFDNLLSGLFTGPDDLFDLELGVAEEAPAPHREIRHHDCMWAGHCASSEHPSGEPRAPLVPTPPVVKPARARQQSVLKPSLRQPLIGAQTPQTPPMSDDEEKSVVLNDPVLLQLPGLYEDDDDDLDEYFRSGEQTPTRDAATSEDDDEEDDDEEEEEEEEDEEDDNEDEEEQDESYVQRPAGRYAPENDHSYHKGKSPAMRVENLGIDTPSDSEEEIDVVSIDKKFLVNQRLACSLPTNPSRSDRRHLQRTMSTAIGPRGGAKRPAATVAPPAAAAAAKRRCAAPSVARAPRQYRVTRAPYRRRNYQSSESDNEPSEKRNLHNNMERQRRIDLRNAFEDLRRLVPEVYKKDRAAKVVILREAAFYCGHLRNTSGKLINGIEELKQQQERLRNRVSYLRRNLAQKR